MNYLKQLLQQFHINQSQSSNTSQRSPQQSGQFQVMEFDEDFPQQQGNKKCGNLQGTVSSGKDQSQETESPLKGLAIIKQRCEGPEYSEQQLFVESQRKLSREYTIIELDPLQHQNSLNKNGSASTIQIGEYYMIVNTQELGRKFQSQQQWQCFYKKVNDFNLQQVQSLNNNCRNSINESTQTKQLTQTKSHGISLTFKQLNSILQIRPEQLNRRRQYWNSIALPTINIKFKHTQLANKKDPKKLQQNVTKIMDKLAPILLYEIADKKYKPIENVEDELERWRACLIKVLTFYGANDKQIGYSKGLEYVVLGVLVAKPFCGQCEGVQNQPNKLSTVKQETPEAKSPTFIFPTQSLSPQQQQYSELQSHFKYLMFTRHLRNMYFPGTPKLYQQIQLLTQLMRLQTPQIYLKLQQMKVDFIKLFINYYKTFLLYRVRNPQVIRKVMQLLVIYGIELVKIMLTRIMARQEKRIVGIQGEEIQLLRYIAEGLVVDYFGGAETEEVILKFRQLFILDTIS